MRKRVVVRVAIILGMLFGGSGGWLRAEAKPPKPTSKKELVKTFNGIYSRGDWAKDPEGKGTSGSGSTLDDLSAPPFRVKGLIELPIKFGDQGDKLTQILPLF